MGAADSVVDNVQDKARSDYKGNCEKNLKEADARREKHFEDYDKGEQKRKKDNLAKAKKLDVKLGDIAKANHEKLSAARAKEGQKKVDKKADLLKSQKKSFVDKVKDKVLSK